MLPGVGIFGFDPISKLLIELLRHFGFDIHAIWTNNCDLADIAAINALISNSSSSSSSDAEGFPKLITTSVDAVLLNRNVNLVFVCCQPSLHSQISTKALGIGKNVICLFPTCQRVDDIRHMLGSARYYPSLMSSVNYGGVRFLSEFKLLKRSMPLIGVVKVCNVVINCQNIALHGCSADKRRRRAPTPTTTAAAAAETKSTRDVSDSGAPSSTSSSAASSSAASMSSLFDRLALLSSMSVSSTAVSWTSDRDLGAGMLNRFGAAIIALVLELFDGRKVSRVFGCLRTFVSEIDETDNECNDFAHAASTTTATTTTTTTTTTSRVRSITADDHCTFQMHLEPGAIMVNVTINSLAQCKYSQDVVLCGTEGVLAWQNERVLLRSCDSSKIERIRRQQQQQQQQKTDNNNNDINSNSETELELSVEPPVENNNNNNKNNNNNSNSRFNDSNDNDNSGGIKDDHDDDENSDGERSSSSNNGDSATAFLANYKHIEHAHPELPLVFMRGLYYYLARVKRVFLDMSQSDNSISGGGGGGSVAAAANNRLSELENFEYMRVVQLIVDRIAASSSENRWVTVTY